MNEKEEVLNRLTGRLNLYRISQSVNAGYDTYSDAVVAAHNEEEARNMHPGTGRTMTPDDVDSEAWAPPKDVTVELFGVSVPGMEVGVVCASFHAG